MSEIGKTYCLGSVRGTIEFTWIIDNFSKLNAGIEQAYTSERYNSEGSFYAKDGWVLRIYPGGISNASAGFISLYLLYENFNKAQFHVEFTFNIRNAKGKTLCLRTATHDFFFSDGFGFPELIRRDELIRKLQGDRLIINTKVNYSSSAIRNTDSVKLILDDVSLHTKFHENFKAFLKNEGTSDAVISVDGVDLPVHTSILSARSKVLAAMFKEQTIEKTSPRLEITDFELNTVKSLLQFIYSASVEDMSLELALDLLKAADKYDLCDLIEYCSNYLMALTDDKNIVRILTTADMCKASRLREWGIEYFCMKEMEFGSEEDCLSFVQNPKLQLDIIKLFKRNLE